MAIKYFTKQYAGMLPDLFAKKSAFLRAFGGVLQVKDGVTENDTFMELKVSDTDVVIQAYSTDANVGFGSGTMILARVTMMSAESFAEIGRKKLFRC